MRRVDSVAAASVIALTAVHAFAQQSANPGASEPPYGYSHMWGGGWGWHSGMMIGPIVMLLALVGIVTLIRGLVRCFCYGGCCHWHRHGPCPHCGHWHGRAAQDILEERLAKGEIGKDEFEEKRKLLGR
jgi:putative membrane protein